MKREKIKCWVVYDDEYPKGIVYQDRGDALEYSEDIRKQGHKAYTRVKYFTNDELEVMEED